MKFTVNWLKQYIDISLSPQQIADHLTMLGLEVDSITALGAGLHGILVGRILEVVKHPNADSLHLCRVIIGDGTEKKIVCGAPNASPGMLAPIALPGAILPGGLTIRETRIRGELSEGMLCSEKDLGLSDDHKGLMVLPEDINPGSDFINVLGLDDFLIEVDLTPNRPDCTSVIGIARELGGVVGKKIHEPVTKPLPLLNGTDIPFTVTVEDVADCPRYTARLLKNVSVRPSPLWLRNRLRAVGLRSINNVVDVTNFVMLECGQPLHAFDFRNLEGGRIVIRKPRNEETHFSTLDGVVRELGGDTLLICDAKRPVAIAGVMGGENSEVSDSTTEILLESACFNPISIRRTTKKCNIGTDASYRFERGVDPELAPRALERAVELLVEIAGAQVVPNGVDVKDGIAERLPIRLRKKRVNDLLGLDLSIDEIATLLERIDIHSEFKDQSELVVQPPSFRVDLEREVDLIEEVARLFGYNQISTKLPLAPIHFPEEDIGRRLRKKAAMVMVATGFFEVINYSFIDEKHFDRLELPENDLLRQGIQIKNPLAEDQGVMRTTLLPGLLENARRNINFQNASFRLFEIGKVFHPTHEKLPREVQRLTGVMSGCRYPFASRLHYKDTLLIDIFDVKGAMQLFLAELGMKDICFSSGSETLSYAQADSLLWVTSGDLLIGNLGKLQETCLKRFNIKQDIYFFDINLDVCAHYEIPFKKFTPLPKFQPVKWDLAVSVPLSVKTHDIVQAIKELENPLIVAAEVFDVYLGDQIQNGQKSVAITITYRAVDKTLDDETIGKIHSKLIDFLLPRFQGQLREM